MEGDWGKYWLTFDEIDWKVDNNIHGPGVKIQFELFKLNKILKNLPYKFVTNAINSFDKSTNNVMFMC